MFLRSSALSITGMFFRTSFLLETNFYRLKPPLLHIALADKNKLLASSIAAQILIRHPHRILSSRTQRQLIPIRTRYLAQSSSTQNWRNQETRLHQKGAQSFVTQLGPSKGLHFLTKGGTVDPGTLQRHTLDKTWTRCHTLTPPALDGTCSGHL